MRRILAVLIARSGGQVRLNDEEMRRMKDDEVWSLLSYHDEANDALVIVLKSRSMVPMLSQGHKK